MKIIVQFFIRHPLLNACLANSSQERNALVSSRGPEGSTNLAYSYSLQFRVMCLLLIISEPTQFGPIKDKAPVVPSHGITSQYS